MVFIRKKALAGTPKCVITLSPCGCCLQVLSHKKIEEFRFRMWKLSSSLTLSHEVLQEKDADFAWRMSSSWSFTAILAKNSSKCDNTQEVWLKFKSSEQSPCETQCKHTRQIYSKPWVFHPRAAWNNTAAWPSTPTLPFLQEDWFGTMSLNRKWAVSPC